VLKLKEARRASLWKRLQAAFAFRGPKSDRDWARSFKPLTEQQREMVEGVMGRPGIRAKILEYALQAYRGNDYREHKFWVSEVLGRDPQKADLVQAAERLPNAVVIHAPPEFEEALMPLQRENPTAALNTTVEIEGKMFDVIILLSEGRATDLEVLKSIVHEAAAIHLFHQGVPAADAHRIGGIAEALVMRANRASPFASRQSHLPSADWIKRMREEYQFRRGEIWDKTSGLAFAAAMAADTTLTDEFAGRIYQEARRVFPEAATVAGELPFVLVAEGSYARGELNRAADRDGRLFMRSWDEAPKVREFLSAAILEILGEIWSQSLINDPVVMDTMDEKVITMATELLEARFLAGSREIFDERMRTFDEQLLTERGPFIWSQIGRWNARYQKYGRMNGLFDREPNIKDGVGGLRAVHFSSWIVKAFLARRAASWQDFLAREFATSDEIRKMTAAYEFLLQVRHTVNAVKGQEGKLNVLSFDVQADVAKDLDYRDDAASGSTAQEQLLHDYYVHSLTLFRFLLKIFRRVSERMEPPQEDALVNISHLGVRVVKRWGKLLREDIGFTEVSRPQGAGYLAPMERVRVLEPDNVMPVFLLAAEDRLRLRGDLLDAIEASLPAFEQKIDHDVAFERGVENSFFQLMGVPADNSYVLRRLEVLGLRPLVFAEFEELHLQAAGDIYHRYTLDFEGYLAVEFLNQLMFSDELKGDEQETQRHVRPLLDWIIGQNLLRALRLALYLHPLYESRPDLVESILSRPGIQPEEADLIMWFFRHGQDLVELMRYRGLEDSARFVEFAHDEIRGDFRRWALLVVATLTEGHVLRPESRWLYEWEFEAALRVNKEIFEHRDRLGRWVEEQGRDRVAAREARFGGLAASEGRTHVSVTPLDIPGMAEVVVYHRQAEDKPGRFAKIAGVFGANRLSILTAHVGHIGQPGNILDIFIVNSSNPAEAFSMSSEDLWQSVQRDLTTDLRSVLELGAPLAAVFDTRHRIYSIERPKTVFAIPTKVSFRPTSGRTWLRLETVNRSLLRHTLGTIMSALDINILWSSLDREGYDERVGRKAVGVFSLQRGDRPLNRATRNLLEKTLMKALEQDKITGKDLETFAETRIWPVQDQGTPANPNSGSVSSGKRPIHSLELILYADRMADGEAKSRLLRFAEMLGILENMLSLKTANGPPAVAYFDEETGTIIYQMSVVEIISTLLKHHYSFIEALRLLAFIRQHEALHQDLHRRGIEHTEADIFDHQLGVSAMAGHLMARREFLRATLAAAAGIAVSAVIPGQAAEAADDVKTRAKKLVISYILDFLEKKMPMHEDFVKDTKVDAAEFRKILPQVLTYEKSLEGKKYTALLDDQALLAEFINILHEVNELAKVRTGQFKHTEALSPKMLIGLLSLLDDPKEKLRAFLAYGISNHSKDVSFRLKTNDDTINKNAQKITPEIQVKIVEALSQDVQNSDRQLLAAAAMLEDRNIELKLGAMLMEFNRSRFQIPYVSEQMLQRMRNGMKLAAELSEYLQKEHGYTFYVQPMVFQSFLRYQAPMKAYRLETSEDWSHEGRTVRILWVRDLNPDHRMGGGHFLKDTDYVSVVLDEAESAPKEMRLMAETRGKHILTRLRSAIPAEHVKIFEKYLAEVARLADIITKQARDEELSSVGKEHAKVHEIQHWLDDHAIGKAVSDRRASEVRAYAASLATGRHPLMVIFDLLLLLYTDGFYGSVARRLFNNLLDFAKAKGVKGADRQVKDRITAATGFDHQEMTEFVKYFIKEFVPRQDILVEYAKAELAGPLPIHSPQSVYTPEQAIISPSGFKTFIGTAAGLTAVVFAASLGIVLSAKAAAILLLAGLALDIFGGLGSRFFSAPRGLPDTRGGSFPWLSPVYAGPRSHRFPRWWRVVAGPLTLESLPIGWGLIQYWEHVHHFSFAHPFLTFAFALLFIWHLLHVIRAPGLTAAEKMAFAFTDVRKYAVSVPSFLLIAGVYTLGVTGAVGYGTFMALVLLAVLLPHAVSQLGSYLHRLSVPEEIILLQMNLPEGGELQQGVADASVPSLIDVLQALHSAAETYSWGDPGPRRIEEYLSGLGLYAGSSEKEIVVRMAHQTLLADRAVREKIARWLVARQLSILEDMDKADGIAESDPVLNLIEAAAKFQRLTYSWEIDDAFSRMGLERADKAFLSARAGQIVEKRLRSVKWIDRLFFSVSRFADGIEGLGARMEKSMRSVRDRIYRKAAAIRSSLLRKKLKKPLEEFKKTQRIPEAVFRRVMEKERGRAPAAGTSEVLFAHFGIAITNQWARLPAQPAAWMMSGVRPPRPGPVVTTLPEMPVARLTTPLDRMPVLSGTGNSSDGVYAAIATVGGKSWPVAVNKFFTFWDPEDHLDELIIAQIFDLLGVGPRFYGVVRDADGKIIGYAMEIVNGREETWQETFEKEAGNKPAIRAVLESAGLSGIGEFLITPPGERVIIDAGSMEIKNVAAFQAFLNAHAPQASQGGIFNASAVLVAAPLGSGKAAPAAAAVTLVAAMKLLGAAVFAISLVAAGFVLFNRVVRTADDDHRMKLLAKRAAVYGILAALGSAPLFVLLLGVNGMIGILLGLAAFDAGVALAAFAEWFANRPEERNPFAAQEEADKNRNSSGRMDNSDPARTDKELLPEEAERFVGLLEEYRPSLEAAVKAGDHDYPYIHIRLVRRILHENGRSDLARILKGSLVIRAPTALQAAMRNFELSTGKRFVKVFAANRLVVVNGKPRDVIILFERSLEGPVETAASLAHESEAIRLRATGKSYARIHGKATMVHSLVAKAMSYQQYQEYFAITLSKLKTVQAALNGGESAQAKAALAYLVDWVENRQADNKPVHIYDLERQGKHWKANPVNLILGHLKRDEIHRKYRAAVVHALLSLPADILKNEVVDLLMHIGYGRLNRVYRHAPWLFAFHGALAAKIYPPYADARDDSADAVARRLYRELKASAARTPEMYPGRLAAIKSYRSVRMSWPGIAAHLAGAAAVFLMGTHLISLVPIASVLLFDLVTLVFLTPVLEEIVFRGILQDYALRPKTGKVAAALTTAVVFAAAHFFFHPLTLGAVLAYLLSGLAFSGSYAMTGRLRVNIGFHVFANVVAYVQRHGAALGVAGAVVPLDAVKYFVFFAVLHYLLAKALKVESTRPIPVRKLNKIDAAARALGRKLYPSVFKLKSRPFGPLPAFGSLFDALAKVNLGWTAAVFVIPPVEEVVAVARGLTASDVVAAHAVVYDVALGKWVPVTEGDAYHQELIRFRQRVDWWSDRFGLAGGVIYHMFYNLGAYLPVRTVRILGMADQAQLSRYEFKFPISEETALKIRRDIQPFMELDEYGVGRPDLSYPIHSIYLDSPDMVLFMDKIAEKMSKRYKLRIRFYDDNPDNPVFFEIKYRTKRRIGKMRVPVNRSSVPGLLAGFMPTPGDIYTKTGVVSPKHWAALKEFHRLMIAIKARPKNQISYVREAYLGKGADISTRLTVDRHVVVKELDDPMNPDFSTDLRTAKSLWGDVEVAEFKWTGREDEMPELFKQLILNYNLQQQSYPKYCDGVMRLNGEWNLRLSEGSSSEGFKRGLRDDYWVEQFVHVEPSPAGPMHKTDADGVNDNGANGDQTEPQTVPEARDTAVPVSPHAAEASNRWNLIRRLKALLRNKGGGKGPDGGFGPAMLLEHREWFEQEGLVVPLWKAPAREEKGRRRLFRYRPTAREFMESHPEALNFRANQWSKPGPFRKAALWLAGALTNLAYDFFVLPTYLFLIFFFLYDEDLRRFSRDSRAKGTLMTMELRLFWLGNASRQFRSQTAVNYYTRHKRGIWAATQVHRLFNIIMYLLAKIVRLNAGPAMAGSGKRSAEEVTEARSVEFKRMHAELAMLFDEYVSAKRRPDLEKARALRAAIQRYGGLLESYLKEIRGRTKREKTFLKSLNGRAPPQLKTISGRLALKIRRFTPLFIAAFENNDTETLNSLNTRVVSLVKQRLKSQLLRLRQELQSDNPNQGVVLAYVWHMSSLYWRLSYEHRWRLRRARQEQKITHFKMGDAAGHMVFNLYYEREPVFRIESSPEGKVTLYQIVWKNVKVEGGQTALMPVLTAMKFEELDKALRSRIHALKSQEADYAQLVYYDLMIEDIEGLLTHYHENGIALPGYLKKQMANSLVAALRGPNGRRGLWRKIAWVRLQMNQGKVVPVPGTSLVAAIRMIKRSEPKIGAALSFIKDAREYLKYRMDYIQLTKEGTVRKRDYIYLMLRDDVVRQALERLKAALTASIPAAETLSESAAELEDIRATFFRFIQREPDYKHLQAKVQEYAMAARTMRDALKRVSQAQPAGVEPFRRRVDSTLNWLHAVTASRKAAMISAQKSAVRRHRTAARTPARQAPAPVPAP
ncbi:MAG: VTC domain-containing protein, partial [Candidatus Omnitrophota bacterium]|nr:VTC domain-containing protein [Candidatus Omnitrophota bacterium]